MICAVHEQRCHIYHCSLIGRNNELFLVVEILIYQILLILVIMALKMNLQQFYQMEDFQDLVKLGTRYEMEQVD